jgi:6-phosphogluconolactonase (cycloisomerase 2 family)
MRMKFNKSSQLALVAAASLLAATLVTACSQLTQTLTVDFVFAASSKAAGANNYGEINVFEIDSESGRMRQIPSSPFPSAGRDPVAETVSADNASLFVANQDDNSIVQFVIGSDGKLYPYDTENTAGIYPLALAANKSNLFVLDTYEPLPICSTADPCSGSIGVFPLTTATSSTPVKMQTGLPVSSCNGLDYVPLTLTGGAASDIVTPTGLNILADGSALYVTAYDSTANTGYVYGYSIGSTSCTLNGQSATVTTLTPIAGMPLPVGVHPSAIGSDSASSYIYVTDYAKGQVLAYSVAPATASNHGALTQMSGSPFQAGNQPAAIAVDQKYPYVYVANSLDATVSAYSYSMSNGALTNLGTYETGLQPVAIGIDPSTFHFLYTANYLGNNVTGYELSTTTGTLVSSQFSPFTSNDQPTAVAAIPHNGTGAGVK